MKLFMKALVNFICLLFVLNTIPCYAQIDSFYVPPDSAIIFRDNQPANVGPFVISTGATVSMRANDQLSFEDGCTISGSLHAYIKKTTTKPIEKALIASSVNMSINPNPSNNFISLSFKTDGDLPTYTLQIFNILDNDMHLSHLMSSVVNRTDLTKIDVTSLPSGSYILKVTFQTGQIINKLFTVVR
jgi:hypothetical protein